MKWGFWHTVYMYKVFLFSFLFFSSKIKLIITSLLSQLPPPKIKKKRKERNFMCYAVVLIVLYVHIPWLQLVILQVYYKFISLSMLTEPLMLISGIFLLFVSGIIYMHADLSISKSSPSYLAKLQWDEVSRLCPIMYNLNLQLERRIYYIFIYVPCHYFRYKQ